MNATSANKLRDILRQSYEHAKASHDEWNEYLALARTCGVTVCSDEQTAINAICSFSRIVSNSITSIDALINANHIRFSNTSVLEAELKFGTHTHKIVVGKPNDVFHDPFIPLSSYRALRKKYGMADGADVVSNEDYDVLVVDRNVVVLTIKHLI